jgi:hypothetical protein
MIRETHVKTVTIANGAALSDAIDVRDFVYFIVHMPSAWTAASLGFQVATSPGATYAPLYDDDGNLVQIDSPAATKAYSAPAALGGAHFLKLWSQNGTATNTNQAAERSLVLELKS